jgi:hypothetical protein
MNTHKKLSGKSILIFIISVFALSSCGPSACDCVEQYNYWNQDGGLYKLDKDKMTKCTDKYKDADANTFPEDHNSAERNARKKCDK